MVALALSACAPPSPSGTTAAPVEDAIEVTVTATEFAYEPTSLTVPAGEAVNLRLVNEGRALHDLVSTDLDLRLEAGPGGAATGSLVADAPGTYRLVCSVPGHEARGMVLELVVEPAG